MLSELAVPLLAAEGKGEVLGVLNVESERSNAFSSDDRSILELFAIQAAMVLEIGRALAQAEQERKRFELLFQAGRALGEISDLAGLDEAYDIVLRIAERQS